MLINWNGGCGVEDMTIDCGVFIDGGVSIVWFSLFYFILFLLVCYATKGQYYIWIPCETVWTKRVELWTLPTSLFKVHTMESGVPADKLNYLISQ